MITASRYLPEATRIDKHACLSSGTGEEALTFQQLDEHTTLIALWLQRMNVKRLGLHADNSPLWIMVDLACEKAGVIVVPLAGFFSATQLQHAIEACSLDSIITDQPAFIARMFTSHSRQTCPITHLTLLQKPVSQPAVPLPEGTRKVTFTSGTTGHPKGVCLSDENQFQVANSLANVIGIQGGRHLCLLPLAVLLENVAGVYASLLSHGEIVTPPLSRLGFRGSSSIDIHTLAAVITATRPNTLICLPEMLAGLIAAIEHGWRPPLELKFVAVGGAKVSPGLLVKANNLGLPVYEGYGLSECASVVCLNTPMQNRWGTVGKPLPHLSVSIEAGEIVVRGNTFLGYAGDPESWHTTEVATGDLGTIEQGFVQVRGRKKNVLISSFGRNIHPEWVESELLNYPGIAQAFVFGDSRPYCTALIVPRRDDLPDPLIQRWIDQANNALPDYAQIGNWHRLEKPLTVEDGFITANGRPKRDLILEQFSDVISSLYATNDTAQSR